LANFITLIGILRDRIEKESMTNKIKFVFACLVLITTLSVYEFFSSAKNSPVNSSANSIGAVEQSVVSNTDTDGDGLNDGDESVWNTDFQKADTDGDGYLDGEEVASGHDPLISGPKDSLIEQNLTDKLTDLVIGGLYSEDLKKKEDNPNYEKSLNDVALSTIYDFYNSTPLKEGLSFNIVDDSKDNQQNYLNFIADSIQAQILGYPESIKSSAVTEQEYYSQKSIRFRTVGEQLRKQSVPKTWTTLNEQIFNTLQRLAIDYKAISDRDNDPMKALIAVNEITAVIEPQIKSILETINGEIINSKLLVNSTFYQVLGLIY